MGKPSDYREVHKAADVFEPRLERQVVRAFKKQQNKVDIDALALALSKGDEESVFKMLKLDGFQDELTPLVKTKMDAFQRGGRIGEQQVNALT